MGRKQTAVKERQKALRKHRLYIIKEQQTEKNILEERKAFFVCINCKMQYIANERDMRL